MPKTKDGRVKYVEGREAHDCRRFTFSAATQIQNEPVTADGWSTIADDLERALKSARSVADQLAQAEDKELS